MLSLPRLANERRFLLLKALLCGAFFVGILCSLPLWFGYRPLPPLPAFTLFDEVPPELDGTVNLLLLALLGLGILLPHGFLVLLAPLVAFSVFTDQLRLQPWVYQYSFMLVAIAVCHRKGESNSTHNVYKVCRSIVALVYFWSGIQKLNASYYQDVLPWILSLTLDTPELVRLPVVAGAYMAPVLEACAGLLLLTRHARRGGVLFVLLMHLLILCVLGPLGLNWNRVIWPWNVGMMGITLILFWPKDSEGVRAHLAPRSLFHGVVLLLFGVAPIGSFFGVWDYYLSGALYSGNPPYALIEMNASSTSALPERIRTAATYQEGTAATLRFNRLVTELFEVPLIPQERVFTALGRTLCSYEPPHGEWKLIIYKRPTSLLSRHREKVELSCKELTR